VNWEKAVLEKGIGIGEEKGADKTFTIITQNMITNGMSDADISKFTGLSLNKIAQIRRMLKQK
jgi:hypothetical protein